MLQCNQLTRASQSPCYARLEDPRPSPDRPAKEPLAPLPEPHPPTPDPERKGLACRVTGDFAISKDRPMAR